MKTALRKPILLLLPVALALGWMALQPRQAYADVPLCHNYDHRLCFNEEESFICDITGCPTWTLWYGTCSCQGGRWSCTPDIDCGGSAALEGDEADLDQTPAVAAAVFGSTPSCLEGRAGRLR